MDRLVDILFRRSRLVLTCWVLITLAAGSFALGLEGRAVPGGEASASSQSEAVARELAANGVPSLFVVVTGRAAQPGDDGARALEALQTDLARTPGVEGVAPLPLPPTAAGTEPLTVLGVTASGGVDGSIEVAHRLLNTDGLAPEGSETFLGGYPAHREELVELSRSDLLRAEKIGVPIVCVVLLLTFGSLWATLVPLVIGLAALLGGLGAAGALAFGIPFSEYVTNAAAMVGLALAVDYAMFLVQRVGEMVRHGTDMDEAIRATMRTTGVAIAWSGLIVLAAEATMLLVDSRAIRTAGLGMMLVTLAAVVAALGAAPLVIRALGHRILPREDRDRLARLAGHDVPGAHRPRPSDDGSSTFWWRWGHRMTSRPAPWLAAAVLLLAGLSVPLQGLTDRVDLPSASAMPADSQVRQASELGGAAYGAGTLSPIEVVVRGTPATVRAQADQVASALATSPEVRGARVLPLQEPGLARVSVATTHGPAEDRTEALVRDLREGELHASLDGVRYDVGGEAGLRVDATDALFAGLPLMLSVLLALVLVFFTVAMRSVVLAVKATLLVVVSLGASVGVLLALSTTDTGARLIGWSQPEDLHPIVPIMIVAIVTALSTDYEVILLSRIREVFLTTGDNTLAVRDGVARTGRVISSAAAIMIAVFLGFAVSDVTPLKQLGVGLAVAVLIDATVVRGVLVPASMQLLGRWNWWSPLSNRSPAAVVPAARRHAAADRGAPTTAAREPVPSRPLTS